MTSIISPEAVLLSADPSLEEETYLRMDCGDLFGITQISDEGEVMDVFLTHGQVEKILPILMKWSSGNVSSSLASVGTQ